MIKQFGLVVVAFGISWVVSAASAQNFELALPTFESPITSQLSAIDGSSMKELIQQHSPLYPPIEGLPESLWKEELCSSCHQWTQRDLCFQGNNYLAGIPDKLHPFGGPFKVYLQFWAEAGCL